MALPSFQPLKKNFKIWKGATFTYPFNLMVKQNGVLSTQDVTGYTGVLTIEDIDTNVVLLTLTETSGLTFGGPSGLITISIPAATTETLTWTQAKYQLLVTTADGTETDPLLYGRINVFTL